MKPQRTDKDRWAAVLAQHPEALPAGWSEVASELREAGLYVDLRDDDQWHGPGDLQLSEYEVLRPTAAHLLTGANAAYERELQARGSDIGNWRPLPTLPDSSQPEVTKGIPTNNYIVERRHHHGGWLAWTDRDGTVEPIRFASWAVDRSDNLFSDDASNLMMLSHAILSDANSDPCSYDDLYRDDRGEHQLLWRRFFEEHLVSIDPGKRRAISREDVQAWSARQAGT
jgi:hypothetical protein